VSVIDPAQCAVAHEVDAGGFRKRDYAAGPVSAGRHAGSSRGAGPPPSAADAPAFKARRSRKCLASAVRGRDARVSRRDAGGQLRAKGALLVCAVRGERERVRQRGRTCATAYSAQSAGHI
jgi:hypothetical protein